MSIMRCERHGSWDSDYMEDCPKCELEQIKMAYEARTEEADELRVQACRQGDRDMLKTDAGKELIKAAIGSMTTQSDTPQRYNGWELERDAKGPFVRIEDYEQLRQEAAQLRADRDALAVALRGLLEQVPHLLKIGGVSQGLADRYMPLIKATEALEQHGGN
jgi:hypothetical protein